MWQLSKGEVKNKAWAHLQTQMSTESGPFFYLTIIYTVTDAFNMWDREQTEQQKQEKGIAAS